MHMSTHVSELWIHRICRKLDLNTDLVDFWNCCYFLQSKKATSVSVTRVTGHMQNQYIINRIKASLRIDTYLRLSDQKNRVWYMSELETTIFQIIFCKVLTRESFHPESSSYDTTPAWRCNVTSSCQMAWLPVCMGHTVRKEARKGKAWKERKFYFLAKITRVSQWRGHKTQSANLVKL